MSTSRKMAAARRIGLLAFLPAGLVLLPMLKKAAPAVAQWFPACPFYRLTGFYCPACGNTRAVLALLRGDLPGSLRFNITPFLLGVLVLLVYLETVFREFGHPVRFLPRKGGFWALLMSAVFLYYFVRNLIPGMLPSGTPLYG